MSRFQLPGTLEQQLRESEERYRLTFEAASVGIVVADPEMRIARANRAFGAMVGYSPEELLGRTVADISHPDDMPMVNDRIKRLRCGESDREEYDRRYIHKDGSVVWAHVSLTVACHDDGSVAYLVGIVQDIREIRAERLKQSGLAGVGAIALSNSGLGFLFNRAAETVRDLLAFDEAVIRKNAGGELLDVGRTGDGHTSRDTLTDYAITSTSVVVARRADGETFDVQSGGDPGIVTGIAVSIDYGDQQKWGVITASAARPHRLTVSDVDFLRTIATLLGQAIERRRSDVELLIRAVQQSAIAELGRITVTAVTPSALERACELVMEGLWLEQAAILIPTDRGFTVAAGQQTLGNLPSASQPGEALRRGSIVSFDDSLPTTLVVPEGARAGIATPIGTQQSRFGVICAYTWAPKQFGEADLHFIESVALVLGEAMERDASRRALVESERRFRSVVEGASEIIFSVAPTGEFRTLNPAFELVTGWRTDEWIGRPFIELVAEEQRAEKMEIFTSVLREPRHVRMQVRVLGKTRNVLLDVASSAKVRGGQVVEIYGFARDITEEQRLTGKLEQANRLSSLGRLAATVAHEFNNVLMGIAPFTEILRREATGDLALTAVDQISRSVKRGKRITEDILRFAQPAEPMIGVVNVPVWLSALAIEAQSLIGPGYKVEVTAAEGVRITADPHQLHQAFVNLILNARDAMPDGGTITVTVTRDPNGMRYPFGTIAAPERFAHFTVADHGAGIDPAVINHIFEPLFTTKKTGTGLGLPVARQVVTRHGGEMFVESEPGAWTRFHLFIPLAQATDEAFAQEWEAPDRRCRRILLVEDDETVAAGIEALLDFEGVEVEIARTGREVLPALGRSTPDAVVLDIGLPDMDGTAVYESIAEKYPDLPVVFSSGHGDATKLERYLTNPHVAFLLKPYDIDALLQVLDRVTA